MYSDFRQVNAAAVGRESFRFAYKGSDLVKFASIKCMAYTREERQLRDQIAAFLAAKDTSMSDPKLADLKSRAEFVAAEAEKCTVWWHEFARRPDAEFLLTLPDVVYFGLAGAVHLSEFKTQVSVTGSVDPAVKVIEDADA